MTLGIPRMREVLMTEGNTIATPLMTIPLRDGKTEEGTSCDCVRIWPVPYSSPSLSFSFSCVFDAEENADAKRVARFLYNLVLPEAYREVFVRESLSSAEDAALRKREYSVTIVFKEENELAEHDCTLRELRNAISVRPIRCTITYVHTYTYRYSIRS